MRKSEGFLKEIVMIHAMNEEIMTHVKKGGMGLLPADRIRASRGRSTWKGDVILRGNFMT